MRIKSKLSKFSVFELLRFLAKNQLFLKLPVEDSRRTCRQSNFQMNVFKLDVSSSNSNKADVLFLSDGQWPPGAPGRSCF